MQLLGGPLPVWQPGLNQRPHKLRISLPRGAEGETITGCPQSGIEFQPVVALSRLLRESAS